MPDEREGYRAHTALYDAELSGRLYFAMRGIAQKEPHGRRLAGSLMHAQGNSDHAYLSVLT